LTDTSLYIYISRELLATLEEEYFVELGSWLVHCAVWRLLYTSHRKKRPFQNRNSAYCYK